METTIASSGESITSYRRHVHRTLFTDSFFTDLASNKVQVTNEQEGILLIRQTSKKRIADKYKRALVGSTLLAFVATLLAFAAGLFASPSLLAHLYGESGRDWTPIVAIALIGLSIETLIAVVWFGAKVRSLVMSEANGN